MLTGMTHTQPQFGQAVADLLQARNLSQNQASIKAGIDRFTIARMIAGIPPRLDLVEQFARAFGEDVNHWRELAGYPALEPDAWNPWRYWSDQLAALATELGLPTVLVDTVDFPTAETTQAEIDTRIAQLREKLA